MDGRDAIRSQYAFAQDNLEDAIAKCPPELLTKAIDGSLTNPIGATYAHTAITQDLLLVGWLQGREPVFCEGGWGEKTGFELPQSPVITQEWAKNLRFEIGPLREYAAAVREAVDSYPHARARGRPAARGRFRPAEALESVGLRDARGLAHRHASGRDRGPAGAGRSAGPGALAAGEAVAWLASLRYTLR